MSHSYVTRGPGVPPTVEGVPYTPAVVVGDHCYVSGQLAFHPDTGEFRPGSADEEARLAITNLLATLAAAGFAASDLVYVNVLLVDIADWPAVNDVYRDLLAPPPYPARMAYAVAALALGAKVEIQAVAVRDR